MNRRYIYVTGSHGNKDVDSVVMALRKANHRVYSPCARNKSMGLRNKVATAPGNVYVDCLQLEADFGFKRDVGALLAATLFVLVLPSCPNSDVDLGMAVGLRKPACVYVPPEAKKLRMVESYLSVNKFSSNIDEVVTWSTNISLLFPDSVLSPNALMDSLSCYE